MPRQVQAYLRNDGRGVVLGFARALRRSHQVDHEIERPGRASKLLHCPREVHRTGWTEKGKGPSEPCVTDELR